MSNLALSIIWALSDVSFDLSALLKSPLFPIVKFIAIPANINNTIIVTTNVPMLFLLLVSSLYYPP